MNIIIYDAPIYLQGITWTEHVLVLLVYDQIYTIFILYFAYCASSTDDSYILSISTDAPTYCASTDIYNMLCDGLDH